MIKGKRIRLREKKVSDAQDDYAWQTDTELASLDAMPVLSVPFIEYLLTYTNQLLQSPPCSLRLAIETSNGKHIGNCTYYNIDKLVGEAELGIMIGDRNYWGRGYGTETVNALLNQYKGEETLEGKKKIERWELAQRIIEHGGDDPEYAVLELESEQVTMIKDLVSKGSPIPIYARVHEILEAKDASVSDESGGKEDS